VSFSQHREKTSYLEEVGGGFGEDIILINSLTETDDRLNYVPLGETATPAKKSFSDTMNVIIRKNGCIEPN